MPKEPKLTKKLEANITEIYAAKKGFSNINQVDKTSSEFKKFLRYEIKREGRVRQEATKYFKENKERIVKRLFDTSAKYMEKYEGRSFEELNRKERANAIRQARRDFGKVISETKASKVITGTGRVTAKSIVETAGRRKYFQEPTRLLEGMSIENLLKSKKAYKAFKEMTGIKNKRQIKDSNFKYQKGYHFNINGRTYRKYTYNNNGNDVVVLVSDYDPKGENDRDFMIFESEQVFREQSYNNGWSREKNKHVRK